MLGGVLQQGGPHCSQDFTWRWLQPRSRAFSLTAGLVHLRTEGPARIIDARLVTDRIVAAGVAENARDPAAAIAREILRTT